MTDQPVSPEERQHYTNYYVNLLQKRLETAISHVRENRQPRAIQEHMASWLEILRQSHRPELYQYAINLIYSLHPWPLHWGYWDDWEQELIFAIDAANKVSNPSSMEAKAEFLTNLANIKFLTGRRNEALDLGIQAFSFSKSVHSIVSLSKSGCLAASILIANGEPQRAKDILVEIEQIINSQVVQDASNGNTATALAYFVSQKLRQLRQQGKLDDALMLIDNLIDQMERVPQLDPNVLAESYSERSGLHWQRDEFDLAIKDLNQSIKLVSDAGLEFAESAFRGNLGLNYWSVCEFKLAEETLRHCIRLAEESHTYFRLAYDIGNLALVYLYQCRLDEALAMSERHVALASKYSSPAENMRAEDNYGIIKLHLGDYELALPFLEKNLSRYEEKISKADYIFQATSASRCYAALGEVNQAINLAQKALNYAEQQDRALLKINALRCMAELVLPIQSKALLYQALELARQHHRLLDEAACLLSLASLTENDQSERNKMWKLGVQILTQIGAQKWVEGFSPSSPPLIVL